MMHRLKREGAQSNEGRSRRGNAAIQKDNNRETNNLDLPISECKQLQVLAM